MRFFQQKNILPQNKKSASVKTGDYYENLALGHLLREKLRLVEKNYRCKFGEIDLILFDKTTLVFVEVRFRTKKTFGSALESIHERKQRRIIKTAEIYLYKKGLSNHVTCRFDVVTIDEELKKPKVEWIKNAFINED